MEGAQTGPPRSATLTCGLFWDEGGQDPVGSREVFSSSLKNSHS